MVIGRNTSPYLVNRLVDYLGAGGLSLFVLAYYGLVYRSYNDFQVSSTALSLVWGLSWLVNWPHFSASLDRLYGGAESVHHAWPLKVVLPIFIAGLTLFAFLSPVGFAPYFVKVFLLWSLYHYAGQAAGFTLIYAARAGVNVGRWEKKLLWATAYAAALHQWAMLESVGGLTQIREVTIPLMGIPPWVTSVTYGCSMLLASSLAIFWLFQKRPFSLLIALPIAAHLAWFVIGSRVFSFQAFVPFFHGLQYLLLTGSLVPRMPRLLAFWSARNILAGAFLFGGLPVLAEWLGAAPAFASPVLFAAVQIHHFAIDGRIWRARRLRVATSAPDAPGTEVESSLRAA
ncbi:MAG: hypothetical protein EOP11_02445 [Proteobacteria bacterium]|nr:MAG: hypothetical protein EOP11_02445 [Pseudomonadota bacterium]